VSTHEFPTFLSFMFRSFGDGASTSHSGNALADGIEG
jgi:hypothetical protein